jgi:sugar/nucleoside kinase (ribokinase family)
VIVVIGNPIGRAGELGGGVDGVAVRAAIAAGRAGSTVQLVGKTGDDPLGDQVLIALAAAGVGHVAMLRDPSHATPLAVPADDDTTGGAMLEADSEAAIRVVPANVADRPTLEPADVELALHYLPDQRVIVVAESQPDAVVAVASEAAAYAGATLLVVVPPGKVAAPPGAIVVEAPPDDADGSFGAMLGELAALLDSGVSADEAFRTLTARVGLAPVAD